jgi:RNA polymerase sigma-70 factor (ECF subfamily)
MGLFWPTRARHKDRLLLRARRGEREAFRALYRELYDPVARFVGRRVRHREDAEDVVSRTFERLLAKLESFDERRGGALPFALAIARNLLVDDLRAQRPGVALEEAAAQLIETRTPLAEMLRSERIEAARERLDRLAPEVRELLMLRYGDGLSSAEIGGLLGLSTAAVRQRISRALRSLRGSGDHEEGAMAHE